MRTALALALALPIPSLACTAKDKQAASGGEEASSSKDRPEPAPSDELGPTCESDADCLACGTPTDCHCEAGSKERGCPDQLHSCFVDPCSWSEAACGQGHCIVLPPAGPCEQTRDCETIRHPYACEYIAVRAGLPETATRTGMGCAGLPKRPAVHCDKPSRRCVLGPPPAESKLDPAAMDFELRWSCQMHGAAITTRTIVVEGDPPKIRVEGDRGDPLEVPLPIAELRPLVELLASEGLATFFAETPKEGSPAPGMEYCTLSLRSAALSVDKKSWRSTDELSPAAAEAERALGAELGRLAATAKR